MRLVLASASPRRADLLRAAGFVFDTLAVAVDECVLDGETPEDYVRRLAMEKSARALELAASDARRVESGAEQTGAIVLGADTTVIIDGTILGKPVDDEDARRMLERLAGRSHTVLTGISVRTSWSEYGAVESTTVEVASLSAEEIAWYVESGEGRDKAGAYAIQGLASRFIPRIIGSYSNVVGLPVATVHALIAKIASEGSSRLS
jgi:septum formation protein